MGLAVWELEATSVLFEYGTVYNGGTPTSTQPWLTALFEDVASDTVKLTLKSSLEVTSEYIDVVGFNDSILGTLAFTYVSSQGAFAVPKLNGVLLDTVTPITSTIIGAQNSENLVGSGGAKFDFLFEFDNASANRFDGVIDTLIVTISGEGLTAAGFNVKNDPWNQLSLAHIGGIPPGNSGAVGVKSVIVDDEPKPVPDGGYTLMLMVFTLMGLGYLRSRKA